MFNERMRENQRLGENRRETDNSFVTSSAISARNPRRNFPPRGNMGKYETDLLYSPKINIIKHIAMIKRISSASMVEILGNVPGFVGAFPSGAKNLPLSFNGRYPCSYVIKQGQRWCAVVILPWHEILWFDPYDKPPSLRMQKAYSNDWLFWFSKFNRIKKISSSASGYWCIDFIRHVHDKESFDRWIERYSQE
jgi:hypothetical protein